MEWWLIVLIGVAFGLVVIGIGFLPVRSRLEELRLARIAADERIKAAHRLVERLEELRGKADALKERLPQRG